MKISHDIADKMLTLSI